MKIKTLISTILFFTSLQILPMEQKKQINLPLSLSQMSINKLTNLLPSISFDKLFALVDYITPIAFIDNFKTHIVQEIIKRCAALYENKDSLNQIQEKYHNKFKLLLSNPEFASRILNTLWNNIYPQGKDLHTIKLRTSIKESLVDSNHQRLFILYGHTLSIIDIKSGELLASLHYDQCHAETAPPVAFCSCAFKIKLSPDANTLIVSKDKDGQNDLLIYDLTKKKPKLLYKHQVSNLHEFYFTSNDTLNLIMTTISSAGTFNVHFDSFDLKTKETKFILNQITHYCDNNFFGFKGNYAFFRFTNPDPENYRHDKKILIINLQTNERCTLEYNDWISHIAFKNIENNTFLVITNSENQTNYFDVQTGEKLQGQPQSDIMTIEHCINYSPYSIEAFGCEIKIKQTACTRESIKAMENLTLEQFALLCFLSNASANYITTHYEQIKESLINLPNALFKELIEKKQSQKLI